MKLQFASDLHLELQDNSRFLKHQPLPVEGDILILAGDIVYLGNDSLLKHPFGDWASENFSEVLVVPGNHEFYGGYNLQQLHDGWSLEIKPNVHYFYNAVILLNGIEIIMTTLWSNIPVQDAFAVEHGVNDFRRIKSGEEVIDFVRFNEEHQRCCSFVDKAISKPKQRKRIVVTHHLPSFLLMDPQFKGSSLNGAFVSELYDLIVDSDIDYWIFGHSHRNISTSIGSCKCLSNQMGYVAYCEHMDFEPGRFLDV